MCVINHDIKTNTKRTINLDLGFRLIKEMTSQWYKGGKFFFQGHFLELSGADY